MSNPGPQPIVLPAGYVTEQAIAFGNADGTANLVSADDPLPIRAIVGPAASAPLAGTAVSSTIAGPFAPDPGRPIWLTLSGTWSGRAQLLRSTDGGATALPITVAGQVWGSYTANCNEAAAEETVAGASYYLSVTLASGTLAYQVQQ